MTTLHTLKPAKGAVKTNKRLGRGQGSGTGATSGRGHKGDGSRSGHKDKRHFEGGQMPLQRRLPKFGFNNINRVEYKAINLDALQTLAEKFSLTTIDLDALRAHGLVSKNDLVKVLSRGEIKAGLEVHAHAFSKSAVASIEKAGGKAITL